MSPVFVDTHFLVAVTRADDGSHEAALAAAEAVKGRRRVTTDAVLLEFANALCRTDRTLAARSIDRWRTEPDLKCVPVDSKLFERGMDLYRERDDKEWSLTDCISFVVMKDLKIKAALTADRHFEQAGFEALMR
jgi:predicted nucleic acid-binding protein